MYSVISRISCDDLSRFIPAWVVKATSCMSRPISLLDPNNLLAQVVAGILLSDGYVTKPVHQQPNARLEINLGYNVHGLSMLGSVLKLLKAVNLASGNISISRIFDKLERYDSHALYAFRAASARSVLFNAVRQHWYPHGIKIVPDDIAAFLSPICLAFWLYGDGTAYYNGIRLCTAGFSVDDCGKLIAAFNLKYGIQARLIDNGDMVITGKDATQLMHLVNPYLHASVMFKLANVR